MATMQKRKGSETRELILSFAESAVLEKGFAATSIDELIAAVGITKSGFFYHFGDKGALAKALLERYLSREESLFDQMFDRARELHDDPLHSFLIGLKLLAEMMGDLPNGHPGCLVAAFCYQENMFNRDVRDLNREGVLRWRKRFRAHLDEIADRYPPRCAVDLDDLADMLSALGDGGIIVSKVVRDPKVLPAQIMLYREFVRTIFLGTDRN